VKYFYSLLPVLVVFAGVFTAFGQSRNISEDELKRLISDASDKRKGIPLRQRVSSTGYGPNDGFEAIYESGSDDTFHVAITRKTKGVETKVESIRIGKIHYTRQADGTWIKEEPIGSGQGSGSGSGNGISVGKPDVTIDRRFLGTDTIDGQKTSHYRTTEKVTFVPNPPVRTRHVTHDYWFRKDGMLVRESTEDSFENSSQHYKSVTNYEYDKPIKIVAPIP
jgi:hypothetical protein